MTAHVLGRPSVSLAPRRVDAGLHRTGKRRVAHLPARRRRVRRAPAPRHGRGQQPGVLPRRQDTGLRHADTAEDDRDRRRRGVHAGDGQRSARPGLGRRHDPDLQPGIDRRPLGDFDPRRSRANADDDRRQGRRTDAPLAARAARRPLGPVHRRHDEQPRRLRRVADRRARSHDRPAEAGVPGREHGALRRRRGHLVYARGGSLYAVRFDPATLAVSGQPSVVLQGIGGDATTGAAHVALDGRRDVRLRAGGRSRRHAATGLDAI